MRNTDPRVDAYIENAPEYARPILTKLRKLFHRGHPSIEENIKWGTPSFEHKGLVVGMAAFKKQVAFGFWKARSMSDPEGLFAGDPKASPFGVKVHSLGELPQDKVLAAYVREAVELNEKGIKAGPPRRKNRHPAPRLPADLSRELKRNQKAYETYQGFSPSKRREYVDWINDAKREATREKRIATAVEWMAEGKPRNWKYTKRK